MAKIIDVEGIGPKYAEKLIKAGISNTGCTVEGWCNTQGS